MVEVVIGTDQPPMANMIPVELVPEFHAVPFGGGGTVNVMYCHVLEDVIVSGETYEAVWAEFLRAIGKALPDGTLLRNQKLTVTGCPNEVPQFKSVVL